MSAQLTGTKTIPGDYATFVLAVADLNAQGVGAGGVTFNIAAGYTEANVAALLTIGTNSPNASRPVVFRKNGAGANPLFTAGTGVSTSVDGMVVLNGVDYVTFDGIDLQENAANVTTTTQMEWGYALVKSAAANGAQNNTIKNCMVTLNKTNIATVGIYIGNHTSASTAGLTISNFLGTSSYNKFYNNTVQNCYQGITMTGFASVAPFDFYDQGNEVGVDGVSTRRNQILNYGGTGTTASGVSATNQNNLKVFNTFVNNAGGAVQTGLLNGINIAGGTNTSMDIYNDTLTLASNGTTANLNGINNNAGNTGAGNTVNIYNCVVTGCVYNTATTGELRGIFTGSSSTYTNIYNNTISNNTMAGSGLMSCIYASAGSATLSVVMDVHDNTVTGNTRTGTTGTLRLLAIDFSAVAVNTYNNICSNNSNSASNGATYGYYNFNGVGYGENVYNNQIFNLAGGSGETIGLFVSSGPGVPSIVKRISGNVIHDITGNVATVSSVGAIFEDYAMTTNMYQNTIYNIVNNTTTGAIPATYGIRVSVDNNLQNNIYNNFISELKAPNASNTAAIRGIFLEGATVSMMNVYHNTVYLNATSIGANFGTTPIFITTAPLTVDLRNNIFVDASTPTGTGAAIALQRGGTALTNYNLLSGHNCLYAGTPSAANLIYNDGTNSDQTLQALKNRVGPREQASFSELPPFVSLVSPYNLHLQAGSPTQCEGGGQPTGGVATTDFDGITRNASTPDVGADELTGTTVDIASPNIQYTLLTNAPVAANRSVPAFATITDPSGINVTIGTRPRLYYKKSTNANSYVDNTNATDGWKYVEASNGVSPFAFTIDYSLLFGGGVVAGDNIQYFVVAQDLNGTPRIGLNNGGFSTQPTSVALTAANFPLNNTINQYTIVATSYSGVIPVGPAEAITSLTNAGGMFALINAGVVSGNITLNITGDLTAETGTNALNQWAESGGSGYTVSIVPSAGVTRTISGTSASSLIRFDGADRVTIDGRFGGSGSFLTFRNTSNTAPTIGFINDAQNNVLRNSIIESGNTSVSATAGGAVFIGSTTGLLGNDNITITNNEIRDRSDVAGTPAFLINCAGNTTTPTNFNSGIVISNNNLHDWFLLNNANQNAIQITTGNTNFTISGNSMYQTVTRSNTAAGAVFRGINITNGSIAVNQGAFDVNGNFVGGTAPGATGGDMTVGSSSTITFIGISVNTGLLPSTIQNNVIRKINFTTIAPSANTSMFLGIQAAQGVINVTGNTIGAATGTGAITININAGGSSSSFFAGVLATCTNGSHNVNGNNVGGWNMGGTNTLGALIPQYIQYQGTPPSNFTINNNVIGSTTTPNSIQNNLTTAASIPFGIRVLISSGPAVTVSGNTIQNITDLSTAATSASYGILLINQVGATAPFTLTNNVIKDCAASPLAAAPTINVVGIALQGYAGRGHIFSGNTISGISNPNAGAGLGYTIGIQVQGSSTGGAISKNRIFDLRNAQTGLGAGLAGMYLSAGDGWNLSNNMISITNGAGTNDLTTFGVADFCNGAVTLNYNSIYVGGNTGGSTNTYAYARGAASRVNLRNNLLYNERVSATGFGYAVGNLSATPADGWNTASSAYNTFVTRSSARVGEWAVGAGQSFAQWKTISGGDIESYADTTLQVPSGSLFTNAPTGDLTISTANQVGWYVNGKGIAGNVSGNIATDFGGNTRSTTLGTPTDIGANEFTPNVGVNPIPATASAAPAPSTTTTYTFAGRRLGQITWGAAGTVPSAISWSYWSSVPPIGAPGSNINSYWDVTATGGTGYVYDINSYYTVHEQNALADGLLNLGKKTGANPWFYYAGTASSNAAGKFYQRTGLNNFSMFTLGTSTPTPDFTITTTVISGTGTISPAGPVSVVPGNNQAFTIAAGPCFVIDSVFADGVHVGAVSNYEFSNVAANHTLSVKFRSTAVTPSVVISASPGTTICTGTNVTFTAVPTNGGGAPSYQWKKNGGNVGTNSTTYSDNGLLNGDVITVELTSNAVCASPATVTSNTLTISVVASVTPTIVISVSPGSTICPGSSATFTAVATNAGTTPSYQWKKNGGNVGTNSTTYTDAGLVTGNTITCEVTSNDPCASPTMVTSNTITMTVADNTTPTAVCQSVTVTLNGAGTGSTTAAAVNNNSSDNCTSSGSLGLNLSSSSFTCAQVGTNIVTLTVTDGATNTGTCTATVTVVDNIAPVISCTSNISVNNGSGICGAVVTYITPSGTDNCTPTTTQIGGLASGSTFPIGTTTNTFRVSDASSNSATCAFTVTVTDNQLPAITCPANVNMNNASGICGAVVTYTTPNGTDNCTATTTQLAGLASGATFPVGSTTNTFRATDASGNSATCSFAVVITDAESPVWAACPANMTVSTSTLTCDAVVTWTAPTASDNCAVSSSSSTNTPGSTFALGTTTVTYTADDAASNTATCTFTVTVEDNVAPVAACQGVTVTLDAFGNGSTNAAAVDNGSTDNCALSSTSLSQTAFTCSNAGSNTVTLTATDAAGNTGTCTAIVTVVAQAVTGTLSADTTTCGYNVSCASGSDGVVHALGGGGCPGYTYLWSTGDMTATVSGLPAGTYTVTITDGAGGTYVDNVTLTAPSAIAVTSTATSTCFGDSTGSVNITPTGGNDCSAYTYSWSNGDVTQDLSNVPAGSYTVTVTDIAGCTTTHTVTVGSFAQLTPTFTVSGDDMASVQTWVTYQWLLNGSPISGATSSTYTALVTGSYSLLVTDANGCSAISTASTVVGIEGAMGSGLEMSIFPNPARGEFRLRTANPLNYVVTVNIHDMFGRSYTQMSVPAMNDEITFDISAFSAGTYMVEVSTELGQRRLFKLVVQ